MRFAKIRGDSRFFFSYIFTHPASSHDTLSRNYTPHFCGTLYVPRFGCPFFVRQDGGMDVPQFSGRMGFVFGKKTDMQSF